MENIEYYQTLAEKIFFHGINSEEVYRIASYRYDKTFQDLAAAFRQGLVKGIGPFERQIGCIGNRLYEVLQIDTRAFDQVYGKPELW